MAHTINKFGKIYEQKNGDIALDGFSFDCGGEEFSPEEALKAIIDRLKDELKQGVGMHEG